SARGSFLERTERLRSCAPTQRPPHSSRDAATPLQAVRMQHGEPSSRILVVDDDGSSRLVLKSRLTENGHHVVAADTGARGLAEARNARIDIFLVSASLGSGVDGYEVCRRLRGIPETSAVPVVLYHPHAPTSDSLERAFEAGCDAFVTRAELP